MHQIGDCNDHQLMLNIGIWGEAIEENIGARICPSEDRARGSHGKGMGELRSDRAECEISNTRIGGYSQISDSYKLTHWSRSDSFNLLMIIKIRTKISTNYPDKIIEQIRPRITTSIEFTKSTLTIWNKSVQQTRSAIGLLPVHIEAHFSLLFKAKVRTQLPQSFASKFMDGHSWGFNFLSTKMGYFQNFWNSFIKASLFATSYALK